MKADDLMNVKHIGAARKEILKAKGITTIEQLYKMDLEELVKIKTIGRHYGKLIKDAVAQLYHEKDNAADDQAKPVQQAPEEKVAKAVWPVEQALVKKRKEKWTKSAKNTKNLRKGIEKLNKSVKSADKILESLWKGKYASYYLEFEKGTNKLKSRLRKIKQKEKALTAKRKKKIIKAIDALTLALQRVEEKPKKKKAMGITAKIRSVSKML